MPYPFGSKPVSSARYGEKMVQCMLEQGIIEPSEGVRASPIVLVKKKDGSARSGL